MGRLSLNQLASLTYESFRALASDPELSEHERVGFPDSYRAGKVDVIVADIVGKLFPGANPGGRYVEIGPGCSSLPIRLVEFARERGWSVVLVDSKEMLSCLPDWPGVVKVAGKFPEEEAKLPSLCGKMDRVLAYSVVHYAFAEGQLERFVDAALDLLAPGGRLLVGDVPNESKRQRFLASPSGQEFARQFATEHGDTSPGDHGRLIEVDDRVFFRLLERARLRGFDAYWLPQAELLPMANRREDLLFVRP